MMRRCSLSALALGGSSTSLTSAKRFQRVPPRRPLHINDNFMSGHSAVALEGLYQSWMQDPNTVDESFHAMFEDMNATSVDEPVLNQPIRLVTDSQVSAQSLSDSARCAWMIQCFEQRGHLMASLDPLNYEDDPNNRIPSRKVRDSLRLDPEFFGFSPADLNKVFNVGFHKSVGGLFSETTAPMTLAELHARLTKTYCGNIGWDYTHVQDAEHSRWLRDQIESFETIPNSPLKPASKAEQMTILQDLASGVKFEQIIDKEFQMAKRFGLDGGEAMLVGMNALIGRASENGVEEVIIGMAHRGRLSSLVNTCGKPMEAIIKEFKNLSPEDFGNIDGQGDVKYHLGARNNKTLSNGKEVLVEMLCNPSHLECVNPLVQGRTRASQYFRGDKLGTKVLPIEVHGDAAFAGQGVAFETMGLSELGQYHTGGTMHVVVNNQIGFTTDPSSSRSSAHCTDLGGVFHCPVFHVNGDAPEDVAKVFRLAADYRKNFNRSVVIDLVCYRRYGHNESDDPTVTQALMYKQIRARKDIFTIYGKSLVDRKVLTEEEVKTVGTDTMKAYKAAVDRADSFDYLNKVLKVQPPLWEKLRPLGTPAKFEKTTLEKKDVEGLVTPLTTYPDGFKMHKTLDTIMAKRKESLVKGTNIDWGAAEALAFATLLKEGFHVRVSGQDVERATFSQRHAVLHDQNTDQTFTALKQIAPADGSENKFVVSNSSLSEFGVLGFESGYSIFNPNTFVMWEAQFADFANGAQIIFDNFLASGESKWGQQYAPVISMPHGYDGNGPEHSSGRIERFLQGVNEDEDTIIRDTLERHARINMEVTFPSTPAQYYGLIRRHVHRNFRKPWVNFFSKAFLRAPNVSTMEECIGQEFQPVLGDVHADTNKADVKTVILCSGQIYHYLEAERLKKDVKNFAIVRVEQLAPFPAVEIEEQLAAYPKDVKVRWVQEEPKNMGAWYHVEPRLHNILSNAKEVEYIGRDNAASPAAGFMKAHQHQHNKLMTQAFA